MTMQSSAVKLKMILETIQEILSLLYQVSLNSDIE